MFTIAGVATTLSEVIAQIKSQPGKWHKDYPYYLLKSAKSGAASFDTLELLLTRLGEYVTNAPTDGQALARYRGTYPHQNSAMILAPLDRSKVKTADVAAVGALLTGAAHTGLLDKGKHTTDPETGFAASGGVTVREFYVNGAEGRRVTRRTDKGKITYYYSDNHVANTYKYARLV
jgi:hypothetical protein